VKYEAGAVDIPVICHCHSPTPRILARFGPPAAATSCLPVYSPLCVRMLLALLAPGLGHSAFVCPFWPFASSTRVHFQSSVLPVARLLFLLHCEKSGVVI